VLNESGVVRLAGLLTFGRYPQQFFPKLLIDVAVFPTVHKSEPGEARFIDRVLCEGTVGEMLDDAMRSIAKNLRTISYVEGPGRRDELEVPEVVLREALTNALVHREYAPQFLGQAVSVEIYPDRVEILSPGGLWGGKTASTLADGTSRCRNDTLMSLVSSLPPRYGSFPGSPAEGQGSGIPLMIREMEQRGIDRPRFEVGFDFFKVILHRGGGVIPPKFYGNVSNKDTKKRHRMRRSAQETRGAIVELFGTDVGLELSMRDLADRIGTSHSVMRERLKELVAAGVLEPTAPPTSTNRKYRLRT
jgi:ATP-dependent DNA helicase RecG